MASLPMSCSSAARRSIWRSSASKPSTRGDPVGDLGDALRVTRGERRLGVDDARECLGDAVQASVVGGDGEVRRLPLRDVGRLELRPELAVAAEAQEGIDERRVKPAAAPALGDRARGLDAAVGVEDLDRLGEAQDTGRQRDLLAAQAVGHPAPVPVLVEAADRRGGLLREEQHARDLGAAVAPRLHEAARDVALVAQGSQHRDPPPQPRPGAAVRSDHSNDARRPVQSTSFALALAARSSVANSVAMRLALAEQPASLSSSA